MDFSVDNIKKIIDQQKITKRLLPGYGITTAIFCSKFFEPGTPEYKEVYNYLFKKFENFKNKLVDNSKH